MADQTGNLFLDVLSAESRNLLLASATVISLPLRPRLMLANERARYGFFLLSGIASTVVQTPEGEAAEVGVQGSEALVGRSSASWAIPVFDRKHHAA